MNIELRTNLVELLRETGRAHHAAFAATDGADPDWSEYYADELIESRGRATVPVLRITSPNGEERWMPESPDIVRYLETTVA